MPQIVEIPDSGDENEAMVRSPVKKLDKGKGRAVSATPAKPPIVIEDSETDGSATEPDEPPPSPKKRKINGGSHSRTLVHRAAIANGSDSDVEAVYPPRKPRDPVTQNNNLIDGPIPPMASSSSSSSALPPPPAVPPLIDIDADAALAARLSAQWEAEEQAELAREASDELLARMTEKAERMNEKAAEMRRKRGARTLNDSKIIFQVTMDGEGNTLEGDHDADNAAHLALVKTDFDQQYLGIKIKKVTYFVNLALNERFENAKIALGQAERDDTERTLFHGTAEKNVQPILENGFKIGGVDGQVLHGQAYGVGVYLASSPATSLGYTQGCSKMFACRVLLGKQTGKPMYGKPLPVAQNEDDSYAGGSIFVARHADQVLPRYLVEFEYAYAGPNYGGIPPNIANNAGGLFGAMFAGGAGLGLPAAGAVPPIAGGAVPALNNVWNPYVQAPAPLGEAAKARAKRTRKAPARKAAARK